MNIVLDTNVLVAGLLNPFGTCGEIVLMASSGKLTLSFDARILLEYSEVLRRTKFKFEEEKVAALLDYVAYHGKTVASSPLAIPFPTLTMNHFLKLLLQVKLYALLRETRTIFLLKDVKKSGSFHQKSF